MVKFSDKINRRIINKVTSSQRLKPIAKELATMMRVRVRKGFGVSKSKGARYKFRRLEDSTVEARKRQKKEGKLLEGESATRSNLTATGKMTDAMSGTTKNGKIVIYMKEGRRDGVSNNDMIAYHEKMDRPFFHLSRKEYKKVVNLVRAMVNKFVKKF